MSFPPKDTTVYEAPDGRTWVRQALTGFNEDIYTITFTPTQVEKGKWSEMLSFGVTAEDMSSGRTKEKLKFLKREDDHDQRYSIEDSTDGYILTIHSPRWNEDSVGRYVRKGATTLYVTYSQRLGPSGAEKLRFWIKRIKNWPNKTADSRTFDSTSVAGMPQVPPVALPPGIAGR